MIVLTFIIILQISLAVHVYYIISYISKKQDKDFKGFLFTSMINIFLGIFLSVFILLFPQDLKAINLERILFIESGVIFFGMLYVKTKIAVNIYKRTKDPQYFHYSYFGKKVLHPNVVKMPELFTYFLTLPLTLVCGAYFIVKLGCGK
ncbi:MAG TPA: hypothetical protein PL059_01110 [Spirochaetota bacterium]|nr:hypothetical protein [Spirochaetota bacterium]HOJ27651.1 hypothetical protein [Spirochaetota bacterium]HOM08734.1 hypothetical protein [Spirochaetota bacterium]HPP48476.1 hypothetical protein [Spirochaetota bacterium]HXK66434.1 hypothetical protein [Spirochaetota bacterium]